MKPYKTFMQSQLGHPCRYDIRKRTEDKSFRHDFQYWQKIKLIALKPTKKGRVLLVMCVWECSSGQPFYVGKFLKKMNAKNIFDVQICFCCACRLGCYDIGDHNFFRKPQDRHPQLPWLKLWLENFGYFPGMRKNVFEVWHRPKKFRRRIEGRAETSWSFELEFIEMARYLGWLFPRLFNVLTWNKS